MNHQSIFDFFGTIEMLLRACHGPYVTIATILYAKQDMFGFVLHFNVGFNDKDSEILKKTTAELIDVAEHAGGTYYLPYQLFYSKEQLQRAYPEIEDFFAVKKKYSPIGLSNKFYQKYGCEPSITLTIYGPLCGSRSCLLL